MGGWWVGGGEGGGGGGEREGEAAYEKTLCESECMSECLCSGGKTDSRITSDYKFYLSSVSSSPCN